MTSNIDPTFPIEGYPTTESVRRNFAFAKQEIEALQNGGGSLPKQANTVLAGPPSGASALPTYRLLVAADLPSSLNEQLTSINAAHTSLVDNVAALSATVSANYATYYDTINSIDGRLDNVSSAVSVNAASIVSVNTVVSALDTRVAAVSARLQEASATEYTINRLTVVSGANITSATAGHLYVDGSVCATTFYGSGAGLTDLPSAPTSVANFTVNTLTVVNTLNLPGKLQATSATFSATVCATAFHGSGAGLTDIPAGTSASAFTANQLTIVSGASFQGKVSGTAAEFSGVVSASSYSGSGANLTNVSAIFAASATNATFATTATNATNAVNATNATSATFAASATNATNAVNATNATSAVYAFSATNAASATNASVFVGAAISVVDLTVNNLSVTTKANFATAISGSSAVFSANVCAATFYGSGAGLTNLPPSSTSVTAFTVNQLSVVSGAAFSGKVSGTAAEFSGIVSALSYYGDGSNLSNLPTAPTSVAAYTVNQLTVVSGASFLGKVSGTAGEFSGVVSALEVDAPTGSFSTKVSAAALVVSGVVSGSSAVFSGNVSAAAYYGDGSNLSNLPTAPTSVAAYTVNQLTVVSGASFLGKVSGTAAEFSGIVSALELDAPTGNFSTLVSAAALNVSGVVSALEIDAPTGSFSTKVSAAALVISGITSANSGVFSGTVSANEFDAPTGSFSTIVSAAALVVSGVVSGSSAVFSGVVSANELDAPTGSFSTNVSAAALVVSGVVSGSTAVFSGAVSVGGNLFDNIGNVRTVPANSQTTKYTASVGDNGRFITITTGGIVIPSGIFAQGQNFTVYNDSTSTQDVSSAAGVTTYLVGTATTGLRTIAQRGLATVFCVSANVFVITGGGLA